MKTNEIASFLEENLIGDGEIEISRIASLENSKKGDISFIGSGKLFEKPELFSGSCLIVANDFTETLQIPIIKTQNPKLAFAKIGALLHPPEIRDPEVHSSVIIPKSADIGSRVFIGAFCSVGENSKVGSKTQLRTGAKVGDNVTIGENCVLHPNVFVEDNSVIGDNVILHSGVVIGADGFGYVRDTDSHVKFPQVGRVVIENDVEIGANSCVDRGALGETRIGEGTKIDNLVQVAHNVDIGKRVIIAALTGISGSVKIENDCVLGGQVGIADHVTLRSGAVIGAKSAVFPCKIVRKGVWCGIPIQPLNDYKRQNAHIKSIPRLKEKIKTLEQTISDFKNK